MGIKTLKMLRLIIPGILVFIVFILAINNSLTELEGFYKAGIDLEIKDILYLVLFMILGVIYYACDIRYKFWNPFLKRVQDNIKDTLLKPFENQFNNSQKQQLCNNRILLNLFYEFIDNNESLKEKANLVRFNGLIWTSCVDSTIIFSIGSLVILIKYFLTKTCYDLIVFGILYILSLISLGLIFVLTNRHIKLSNEQLEVITDLHKTSLENRLRDLS